MKLVKLIVSVLLVMIIGAVGGVATSSEIAGWYANLVKPALNPPNWVFGPVWTLLYIMIGVALFLYWTSDKKVAKLKGFVVFYLQLWLNMMWSLLFFGWHSPTLALVDIGLLWIVILININMFQKVSKWSGWLLVPYLLWVSFAAYLNFGVWRLN